MGDAGGNGATLAIERFRLPGRLWKFGDQIVVDAVVGVESVEQGKRQLLPVRSSMDA
jgi:hypothetical protein